MRNRRAVAADAARRGALASAGSGDEADAAVDAALRGVVAQLLRAADGEEEEEEADGSVDGDVLALARSGLAPSAHLARPRRARRLLAVVKAPGSKRAPTPSLCT